MSDTQHHQIVIIGVFGLFELLPESMASTIGSEPRAASDSST